MRLFHGSRNLERVQQAANDMVAAGEIDDVDQAARPESSLSVLVERRLDAVAGGQRARETRRELFRLAQFVRHSS